MTMACSGDSQSGLGGTRGHWGARGAQGRCPKGCRGDPRMEVPQGWRCLGEPESVLGIECPQNWGVSVPR